MSTPYLCLQRRSYVLEIVAVAHVVVVADVHYDMPDTAFNESESVQLVDFPSYRIDMNGNIRRNNGEAPAVHLCGKTKQGAPKYQAVSLDGQRCVNVHRLVAETFIPNEEGHQIIDHIDRDVFNNHISNLRWCSSSESNCNRTSKNRVSGLPRGVYAYGDGTYYVRIMVNKRIVYGGRSFRDVAEAGRLAIALRQQHHGVFVCL